VSSSSENENLENQRGTRLNLNLKSTSMEIETLAHKSDTRHFSPTDRVIEFYDYCAGTKIFFGLIERVSHEQFAR